MVSVRVWPLIVFLPFFFHLPPGFLHGVEPGGFWSLAPSSALVRVSTS